MSYLNEDPDEVNVSVGFKEVIDLLKSNSVRALSDVQNIESAMGFIKKNNDDVAMLKDLKKKRAASIDDRIKELEDQSEFLSSTIKETLKHFSMKTVRFPGVGKVSTKETKGTWTIKEEQDLIDFLKKENEYNAVAVEEVKIQKKELNKLLDMWEKIDKVPDCVAREPGGVSVAFTFEKAEEPVQIVKTDVLQVSNDVNF